MHFRPQTSCQKASNLLTTVLPVQRHSFIRYSRVGVGCDPVQQRQSLMLSVCFACQLSAERCGFGSSVAVSFGLTSVQPWQRAPQSVPRHAHVASSNTRDPRAGCVLRSKQRNSVWGCRDAWGASVVWTTRVQARLKVAYSLVRSTAGNLITARCGLHRHSAGPDR